MGMLASSALGHPLKCQGTSCKPATTGRNVSRQSSVDQRVLIDLLCAEMTETARAERLGIARSSYYKQLDKLTREGVLVNRDTVLPGMRLSGSHPRSRHSGTHHAPVLHIWWEDGPDKWSVQGALLDDWDRRPFKSLEFGDTAVVIRWSTPSHQKPPSLFGPGRDGRLRILKIIYRRLGGRCRKPRLNLLP
jgi:hypothetical protein